jgi:hypothetical protein
MRDHRRKYQRTPRAVPAPPSLRRVMVRLVEGRRKSRAMQTWFQTGMLYDAGACSTQDSVTPRREYRLSIVLGSDRANIYSKDPREYADRSPIGDVRPDSDSVDHLGSCSDVYIVATDRAPFSFGALGYVMVNDEVSAARTCGTCALMTNQEHWVVSLRLARAKPSPPKLHELAIPSLTPQHLAAISRRRHPRGWPAT